MGKPPSHLNGHYVQQGMVINIVIHNWQPSGIFLCINCWHVEYVLPVNILARSFSSLHSSGTKSPSAAHIPTDDSPHHKMATRVFLMSGS